MMIDRKLSPDQACEVLLDLEVDLETEEISIQDGLNRVVAEDIFARIDVPSFDKSPYDGYAINANDTAGASKDDPIEFEIVEEIPAGHYPTKKLGKLQAAKILTGGALPEGANICIKYEWTEFTDKVVKVFDNYPANINIVRKGEDCARGSLLVEKGSILTPGFLGVLSSQGIDRVMVYKRSCVGLFTTGSELCSPGEDLEPGKIYDSNNITFKSILEKLGFVVNTYGIVEDSEEKIMELTKRACEENDVVISTGGASVGDYDYALSSVEKLGGKVLFWKTAMKPGGSLVVSRLYDKTVIGLSGNPGSAILGLFRVCFPYLKKLLGRKNLYINTLDLYMKHPLNKKSPRLRLLRGSLEVVDGKAYFVEKIGQGNGVLSSFSDCDLLAEVPAGSDELEAGSLIKAYRVESIFGNIGE